jgi:hypothetical protein
VWPTGFPADVVNLTISVVVGAVVGAVVVSIVLLLIGLTAGLLLCYCCTRARKPHPSLPVNIHEDVGVHRHTQEEIKMDDNVAYGDIQH